MGGLQRGDESTRASIRTLASKVFFGALVSWCTVASFATARASFAKPTDPMPALEAEFLPFAKVLPRFGDVGYLEDHSPTSQADAERRMWAAQYALVPRVILSRVAGEYALAPAGNENPVGDERLRGYAPVVTLPNGNRLVRRIP